MSSRYPEGWDEQRIQAVLQHYEQHSADDAVEEDDAAFESPTHTAMPIPVDLVPEVRALIAKRNAR
jgi:hypothetical protein